MTRYILAAFAFKAFSLNRTTKWAYRKIGNSIGQRAPTTQYLGRGNLFLDLCREHRIINDGAELLELGTGWLHWHSVFLRLHYDVRITMFDVWDNRQFHVFRERMQELQEHFTNQKDPLRKQLILLDQILSTRRFEELYELLDLRYLVDQNGSLAHFSESTFDCVFSSDVMEHIKEDAVDQYLSDVHRVLKPGGVSLHWIACDDHLSHYDPLETPKTYLRFSQRTWKFFFENNVQYFNRLQKPDWLQAFDRHGFELVDLRTDSIELRTPRIAEMFQQYEMEDLACTRVVTVHRKRAGT